MKLKKNFSILILIFIIVLLLSGPSFASNIKILEDSTSLETNNLSIGSGAALLVETSTNRILFNKNAYKKMYPASTTKIMTAILVIENCNLNDIATVSQTALQNVPPGYVNCKLQLGEQLSIKDLLNALMIMSANDAAFVLAEHVAGSVEEFSNMMNEKAKQIGCTNTNFVNPNGIHNENHYTTAYDLYLMGKYGMQYEVFKSLVSSTSSAVPATNSYPYDDRIYTTTNELIKVNNNDKPDNYYYKYTTGIKTGYTSQAKNCIVASAERDGLEFIVVILHGETTNAGLSYRYVDSINLFNYAYDNFTLSKIKEPNMIIETIEISNATKETKNLDLLIKDSITVINNKSTDIENLLPTVTLHENLQAPIQKGDIVGIVSYTVDGVEYSSELLSSSDVSARKDISIYILILGIILLLFSISIIIKKRKISKKKRRKKK